MLSQGLWHPFVIFLFLQLFTVFQPFLSLSLQNDYSFLNLLFVRPPVGRLTKLFKEILQEQLEPQIWFHKIMWYQQKIREISLHILPLFANCNSDIVRQAWVKLVTGEFSGGLKLASCFCFFENALNNGMCRLGWDTPEAETHSEHAEYHLHELPWVKAKSQRPQLVGKRRVVVNSTY